MIQSPKIIKPSKSKTKIFPKGFLWGASTAGHQVEGGNYDQWTVWELANAHDLAKNAKNLLGSMPNWPKIAKDATNPENYVSGKGVDHYHNYKIDFDILKKLNLNAFRFSIEWSRLEPEEGSWDQEEINHYHNYIDALKKRGIEPVLNLWHWTHPVWFEYRGAWGKGENLTFWLRFIQKVADEFGQEVKYITTINEPSVYTGYSYLLGQWPPNKKMPISAIMVYWHLVRAHRLAYRILKKSNPKLQIGVAAQIANNLPNNKNRFFDKTVVKVADYIWNWWFLNRLKSSQDFIGLNYYFTDYYNGIKKQNPKLPLNDRGWYMEPAGISAVINKLWAKYHKPIMITENGLADEQDSRRQWWLKETTVAIAKSIKSGAIVIGYLHWSLLDNFEWSTGWWPKFGLVEVDRKNGMKRKVRASAIWWSAQIKKL